MWVLLICAAIQVHAAVPIGATAPKVAPEVAPEAAPARYPAAGDPDSQNPQPHTEPDAETGRVVPDSDGKPVGSSDSDASKSDIGEHLNDIVDGINSILGSAGTTTAPTSSVPTAAYGCLSAESMYSACSASDTAFNTAATSYQASCLCQQTSNSNVSGAGPVFYEYMSSCKNYVLTATRYTSDKPAIASAVDLCATTGNVQTMSKANAWSSGAAYPASSSAVSTPTSLSTFSSGACRWGSSALLSIVTGNLFVWHVL